MRGQRVGKHHVRGGVGGVIEGWGGANSAKRGTTAHAPVDLVVGTKHKLAILFVTHFKVAGPVHLA